MQLRLFVIVRQNRAVQLESLHRLSRCHISMGFCVHAHTDYADAVGHDTETGHVTHTQTGGRGCWSAGRGEAIARVLIVIATSSGRNRMQHMMHRARLGFLSLDDGIERIV